MCAAAEPLGEVTVVAPDREQSATSHSLTLHHPLRPVRRGERRWQVDGTPTDCVMLAIEALMPERPDFVLSGINHGQNMGEDVLYSGTVAAAMEGLALGVPSIAISFAGGDLRADVSQLKQQVKVLTPLLAHLTSLPNFPANTLFNVNLPPRVRRRRQRHQAHATRPACVFAVRRADEGSVGTTDLLDRRRGDQLDGRAGFGLSRDRGRLRVGDAAASRSHPLRCTRRGGDLVARTVEGGGGGELRGARERLVETLREKGIRDLAVLRAFEMTPRHAFVPTGFATSRL